MRFILISIILFISSCRQVNVYEKQVTLPNQRWHKNQSAVTTFDIEDSTTHQLYLIVRHTERFMYDKLLVKLLVQDTAKRTLHTLYINAPLTNADEKWLGERMDDIWYNRIKIEPKLYLNKGTYRLVLQQQMKDEVLPYLLNVGIALDK